MVAEVFVGREAELARLRAAFDDACAGRGAVLLVTGEPGIGKTRLMRELGAYAREQQALVLEGRSHEAGGAPAYWPWTLALRPLVEPGEEAALRDHLGRGAGEVARIVPELRDRLPDLGEPEPVADPASARFRLFDAVSSFLTRVASTTPLVVALDDLHWADQPTLQLLEHVAADASDARLLLLGAYRDVEVGRHHPLEASLAELARTERFQTVDLHGLAVGDVEAYVTAATTTAPSEETVAALYRETEGNPFFLRETVTLLQQSGATELLPTELPPSVRAAIGKRLNTLSERCNEVLRIAAVAGREFGHQLLEATAGGDPDELLALMEEALDASVIEESGMPGEYRFTHALIQETLLEEIATVRRLRLHGQIGEALEARYGERVEEHAPRLAQHFVESATLTPGHAERAARYSRLAAEQAEAQFAWPEAARHYGNVLALVESAEDGLGVDEAALQAVLGRAFAFSGRPRPAWAACMRAIDLYRERRDWDGIARATLAATDAFVPAQQVIALADTALAAPEGLDPDLEALLLARRHSTIDLPAGFYSDEQYEADARRARQLVGRREAEVTAELTYGGRVVPSTDSD